MNPLRGVLAYNLANENKLHSHTQGLHGMTTLSLQTLAPQQAATVRQLLAPAGASIEPNMLVRLGELGFMPGEQVTVLRRGPGGREPIAVQIGDTVFALRALEARCIEVSMEAQTP
jgi:ferrous iron transport protein A